MINQVFRVVFIDLELTLGHLRILALFDIENNTLDHQQSTPKYMQPQQGCGITCKAYPTEFATGLCKSESL